MVLGLLQAGPRHGYELHRIVLAHGAVYADFKKPTLYHLLHRLTVQGVVEVRAERGTRGRRGERLVFALTLRGKELFRDMLRNALTTYDPSQSTFEIAAAYLPWLPADEAQALLKQRREVLETRHAEVANELDHLNGEPASQRLSARSLATDHALSLLDAELAWMERAARHLAGPHGRTTSIPRHKLLTGSTPT